MESPRLKIREGSAFNACPTCAKHNPFDSTHCSSCVANVQEDGSLMALDNAVSVSSQPNAMSVTDRRATCKLMFKIDPVLGKMLSELPKTSWAANAANAVELPQAVPLLDGTLKNKDPSIGVVTTEALLRVLLSVQHHREGMKAPLRVSRKEASSGSDSSPLSWVLFEKTCFGVL